MKNKKRKTGEELKEHKRINKASKVSHALTGSRCQMELIIQLDPENNKTTVDILFPSDPSASTSNGKASAAMDADQPHPGYAKPLPPAANISTLRNKLANKLAAFASRRQPYPGEADQSRSATKSNGVALGVGAGSRAMKGSAAEPEPVVDEGPSSRDALEEESRRRRGELRDKRRAEVRERKRKEDDGQKGKGKDGEGKGKGKVIPKEDRSVPTAKVSYFNLAAERNFNKAR